MGVGTPACTLGPWTTRRELAVLSPEGKGERDWLLLGEVRAGVVEGFESP